MICETYVAYGCICDICRWKKGHCSSYIAWYWDVSRVKSSTILVDYACVWLIIHQVVRCCTLTWLIYYILSMLSVTCMMKHFFLFWTDYPKKCIIWSFTKLYSLWSSQNFSNENLVESYTKQVPKDKQQGI